MKKDRVLAHQQQMQGDFYRREFEEVRQNQHRQANKHNDTTNDRQPNHDKRRGSDESLDLSPPGAGWNDTNQTTRGVFVFDHDAGDSGSRIGVGFLLEEDESSLHCHPFNESKVSRRTETTVPTSDSSSSILHLSGGSLNYSHLDLVSKEWLMCLHASLYDDLFSPSAFMDPPLH